MAEIAVKSVLSVADIPRRDVRFDLIKLTVIIIACAHSQTKTGGRLHLLADLRLRTAQAEDQARGGDQVGQGARATAT